MKREDEELLVLGALIWLWSEASDVGTRAVKKLERGGARIWEATHPDDDHHQKDLPANPFHKRTLVELAKWAGFPNPNMAAAIAMAESGGVENAIGDNGTSFGLWQIHLPAHPEYTRDEMVIAPDNALAAFKISRGGTNWRPWSTFTSGKYRGFL